MKVTFWGTRGSIPVPEPAVLRYGGNTPCVEVRSPGGALLILDAGSGLRALGQALLQNPTQPVQASLLLTHLHWDHIQGLPFFIPARKAGTTLAIYGPPQEGSCLHDALAVQMQHPYFPVALDALSAQLVYRDLDGGSFMVGDVDVAPYPLHHTCPTLGYRLTCGGCSLAYITDHEPYGPADGGGYAAAGCPPSPALTDRDRALAAFVRGADLLIMDAPYTTAEYAQRVGWGHSPATYCVDVALAAGVRRLALFHHDPQHSDAALDDLASACAQRVLAAEKSLEVFAAAEGDTLHLPDYQRPGEGGRSHKTGAALR
jgi:phosphoribosyl 1,2-cyclic phosphodiesterase